MKYIFGVLSGEVVMVPIMVFLLLVIIPTAVTGAINMVNWATSTGALVSPLFPHNDRELSWRLVHQCPFLCQPQANVGGFLMLVGLRIVLGK